MGNFRSGGRRGFGDRPSGRPSGRSSGGFGRRGSGGRFGERDSGRPMPKYDATCAKCGKRCNVPFRPTGSKPVLCSDCFRQSAGAGDFSRRMDSLGVSSEQMQQINAKLDKIIKLLENLEIAEPEDDGPENPEAGQNTE